METETSITTNKTMQKRSTFLFLFLAAGICSLFAQGEVSKTWVADLGNGNYQNPSFMPIIPIRMSAAWVTTII